MADPDPDRVLVPSLGRPGEDEALAYALESFPDAEIVLLAVVTPLESPLSEGGVLERDDDRFEEARETAKTRLASVAADSSERVRIETVEGRPGTVVPRYASDEAVDHVVMYGHGTNTSGLVRRFLGRDVATTVVERTDEPVTVLG
ncbi:Nucleotide-binding universal stress protein, UspA family [Halobiforma haloterrestris]|uniref:Nucleotide-binding universal stress protein, UspA family n=1 Tax=Natronobacterium haloterrestre TaxID=148448 RepID=A0A1I1HVJ9_NATHA|nr:universal stress protein [Halobiforma haloterrestris]SFC25010.1 Nucleotide-binding universal stress protein, UspA family [Halobiforma haloterrestris]